jgi:hypothetical protein
MNVYIHIYLEDYFVKLLMLAVLPSDKREDLLGTRRLRTASMSSGKCTVLLMRRKSSTLMAPSSQTSVLSPPLAVNLNLANYSDWKLKLFRPFISFLALKVTQNSFSPKGK